ncbi:MAG: glycosyltransferase family 2 protein [Firmicutes bacterium]|nr:glycosyltransferase family 2 protein [Bacillota bacterium]
MFVAVIPVKNEAGNLEQVVKNLPVHFLELIIPVLNGCSDNSLAILEHMNCPNLAPLCFEEPLGIDVPRAVGAAAAMELGAGGVLFVDGDMSGAGDEALGKLVDAVRRHGLDLALTDCYPPCIYHQLSSKASSLLLMREKLNCRLGLIDTIGSATPSHGPHAVSARLLGLANPADFAIPPLLLAKAARWGLKIGLGAEIPHTHLGSPVRSADHAIKIVETIIGDYLSALGMENGSSGDRDYGGREYIGYHNQRRWDLLQRFITGKIKGDCF